LKAALPFLLGRHHPRDNFGKAGRRIAQFHAVPPNKPCKTSPQRRWFMVVAVAVAVVVAVVKEITADGVLLCYSR
jgi:hypothetical protein